MALQADTDGLLLSVEDENMIPTTSSTNNIDYHISSTIPHEQTFIRFEMASSHEFFESVPTNIKSRHFKGKNENYNNIFPTLVFPLGGEKHEHLRFPTHVLHYSVSPDTRFVYAIGQEFRGFTHINVWDLHRGTRQLYNYKKMNNIRHFYALNDKIGYAVSSTNNQENFYLYTVFIDHNLQQIVVDNRITTYIANGHVIFWSSCRYNDFGIVFALVDHNGIFIYKYEYNNDPFGDNNEKSIYIRRGELENYYFGGQPFVFNEHVMFLERELLNFKFTGRVIRIRLDNGKIDVIMTTAAPGTNLFASQYDENQMPSRIKHVERNGQLWSIMENLTINLNPVNGNFYTSKTEKILGVLCLKTWCWRVVQLGIKACYEEISLDVTSSGTIVIIQRGNLAESPIVRGVYFLQNGKPKSLLDITYIAVLKNFKHIRYFNRSEAHSIGIPWYLM